METYGYKVDSDIVKDEGKNRFSRDEDTLAAGSGAVRIGTVLGMVTATGKFKPLAPGASDGTQVAAAVILQNALSAAEDLRVVNLKRRAQVVAQNLVFPDGISAPNRAAALAQLKAIGIIARNGV